MSKDIISKLRDHLDNSIDTECELVYLLAQIRKLLEREDPQHQNTAYTALWMCCHWAVHPDLASQQTTGDFLDKVDRWVSNTVAYLQPRGTWSVVEEHRLFQDFIFLDTIRQQLKAFLKSRNLPIQICEEQERWYDFLNAYGGVIEDGTLALKAKSSPLSAVKQVTFKKGEELTDEHHVPYVIQWRIDLLDGRTLVTEVETVPEGAGNMTAHALQIINNGFTPPAEAR